MVLAVILWLALATVPGIAVLRLSRARWGIFASLAGAFAISFGVIYLVGLVASRLGVPVLWAVAVALGALGLVWVAREAFAARLNPGAFGRLRRTLAGRSPAHYVAWTCLGVGIALGAVTWGIMQAGFDFPPGWDSMHHGYFIRQIIEFQTLDSTVVLSSAPTTADAAPTFYPLAFNLAAALIAQASAVPVSHVILASTIAFGAVVTPVTVFAFATVIDRSRPLVAGVAALVAPFVVTTYLIVETGRVNAVLGLAVTLGAAVVLVAAGRAPRWSLAHLPALSVLGLAGLHTSELPLAIGAAAAVAIGAALRSPGKLPTFWRWLAWGASASVAAIALIVLLEPSLLLAGTQRSGAIGTVGERQSVIGAVLALAALGHAGGLGGPLLVLEGLVLVGLVVPVAVRSWRPWLPVTVVYVAFGALFVALLTHSLGPLSFLASPWYQDFNRLAWSHGILGAVPAAIALIWGLSLVSARVKALGAREPAILAVASLGILAAFSMPAVVTIGQTITANSAPADSDSRVVFGQLGESIARGEVVLDDLRASGSLWMYNDYGIDPLFGNSPYLGGASQSWKERLWLRANLDAIGTDECVAAMIAKYDVSYVYVDSARIWDAVPQFTEATLRAHPEFTLVARSGGAAAYSVDVNRSASCDRDLTAGIVW